MKLHNFITQVAEAQKLRDLGKAFTQPRVRDTMLEAARPATKDTADDVTAGMDAAIHTLTQDQKHLHKKLAHHD